MPVPPIVPAACLALVACSSPEDIARETGVENPAARASASASATGAGKSFALAEDTDLFSYEFAYPAAVGAIPELAARLRADAERGKAELIAEATTARSLAKADGYPYHKHGFGQSWKVVADAPGYLSLVNDFHAYAGGAHGTYGIEGLVWDKRNKRAMESAALFQSPEVLDAAMGGEVCAALDRERAARRGEAVDRGEPFGECPGLAEATILVGSSTGETFDRITVNFAPYVAGSYAEGAYEFDFTMTAAMLDAVKPAYRAAFSASR